MNLPRCSQPCPPCSWDNSLHRHRPPSEALLSMGTRQARGWEGGCKAGAQEGCNGRDQNREGNSIFRCCPTNSAQRDDKKPISSDRHPNPQPSCISIFERHCFQQGGIFPSRFARRDSNGLNTNFFQHCLTPSVPSPATYASAGSQGSGMTAVLYPWSRSTELEASPRLFPVACSLKRQGRGEEHDMHQQCRQSSLDQEFIIA